MKIPSKTEMKMLQTLGKKELTGVEIGSTLKMAMGSIYVLLNRLQESGWVVSSKRRGARFYKMSPVGKTKLKHVEALAE